MPKHLNERYQLFLKNTTKHGYITIIVYVIKNYENVFFICYYGLDFLINAFRLKQRLCKVNQLITNRSKVNSYFNTKSIRDYVK